MSERDGFDVLRLTIESAVELPAVLVVGCATTQDESDRVAEGLAVSFAVAGRRTLVLDANGTSEKQEARAAGDLPFKMVNLAPTRDREARIRLLRADTDVVILHAGVVVDRPSALELVRIADGVIVAVRLGRAIVPADEELPRVLSRLGAPLLGAVTTSFSTRAQTAPATRKFGLPLTRAIR